MSADKQLACKGPLVAQGVWAKPVRYFRGAEVPVESHPKRSSITSSTPDEIFHFIQTIPEHKKDAVSTETLLQGVNNLYDKNYNFYDFETCLGKLFDSVGTAKTTKVGKDGYIVS